MVTTQAQLRQIIKIVGDNTPEADILARNNVVLKNLSDAYWKVTGTRPISLRWQDDAREALIIYIVEPGWQDEVEIRFSINLDKSRDS